MPPHILRSLRFTREGTCRKGPLPKSHGREEKAGWARDSSEPPGVRGPLPTSPLSVSTQSSLLRWPRSAPTAASPSARLPASHRQTRTVPTRSDGRPPARWPCLCAPRYCSPGNLAAPRWPPPCDTETQAHPNPVVRGCPRRPAGAGSGLCLFAPAPTAGGYAGVRGAGPWGPPVPARTRGAQKAPPTLPPSAAPGRPRAAPRANSFKSPANPQK